MSEWKETEIGKVLSEWNVYKVNELVNENILEKPLDGNHGEIHPKHSDFTSEGIPFIMATDVINGKVDFVNCKFISEKQASTLRKGFSRNGDVLLTHKASLGRTAIVNTDKYPYLMLTPQVTYYRVKDKTKLNNIFLKYYFDSRPFQEVLNNHGGGGSTRDYIGILAQGALPILLPPLPEQKSIAEILSSLDDKIDLLHRQNKTLEQLAETVFRQWFVEEEWNGTLSDYIKVQGGFAFKSKDFKENGFAGVIKIRNISMGMIDISNHDCVDESVVKNIDKRFKIKSGDFLIAMTGAEIGKIGIVEKTEKEIWVNQRVGKLEAKVPYGDLIGYLALKSREGQEHIINACAGSAQENISSAGIEEMNFVSYQKEKTDSLGKEIQPLFEKIISNQEQIKTLTKLRDTLLPKLMSGEVRVVMN